MQQGTDTVPESQIRSWAAAAARGDPGAFGELYNRYHDPIVAYFQYRLSRRHIAEELAQDTFVRAWSRRDTFAELANVTNSYSRWIFTIARNLLIDHLKRASTQCEVAVEDLIGYAGASLDPSPTHVAETAEAARLLSGLIAQLSIPQQRVIDARFSRERTLAETAAELDRGINATKALQHRAVMTLRALAAADVDLGAYR